MLNPKTCNKTHGNKFSKWFSVSTKQLFLNYLLLQNYGFGVFKILSSLFLASVRHWLSCRNHWTLTSYSFDASYVELLLPAKSRSKARRGQGMRKENFLCLEIKNVMNYSLSHNYSLWCTGCMWNFGIITVCEKLVSLVSLCSSFHRESILKLLPSHMPDNRLHFTASL